MLLPIFSRGPLHILPGPSPYIAGPSPYFFLAPLIVCFAFYTIDLNIGSFVLFDDYAHCNITVYIHIKYGKMLTLSIAHPQQNNSAI